MASGQAYDDAAGRFEGPTLFSQASGAFSARCDDFFQLQTSAGDSGLGWATSGTGRPRTWAAKAATRAWPDGSPRRCNASGGAVPARRISGSKGARPASAAAFLRRACRNENRTLSGRRTRHSGSWPTAWLAPHSSVAVTCAAAKAWRTSARRSSLACGSCTRRTAWATSYSVGGGPSGAQRDSLGGLGGTCGVAGHLAPIGGWLGRSWRFEGAMGWAISSAASLTPGGKSGTSWVTRRAIVSAALAGRPAAEEPRGFVFSFSTESKTRVCGIAGLTAISASKAVKWSATVPHKCGRYAACPRRCCSWMYWDRVRLRVA